MEKSKTSNIWKTSDRRAKRSELWDSWVVVQHIWGTFSLVAFKVIWGSFGALVIFPETTMSNKLYFFCKSQPRFIKHLLNYLVNGLHKTTLRIFERSKSRSLRFRSFLSCKGAKLGHMLLLNISRKAYRESPLVWIHLTLVTLKGQFQGHSDLESLYLVIEVS